MTGILEVLYCVLIESPEVLNIIQENHIKSIISLLDKHGRNHKVRSVKQYLKRSAATTILSHVCPLFSGLGCALLSLCV